MSFAQHIANPLFVDLGPTLMQKTKDGFAHVKTSEVLKGKVIGLYYSAHWCGPCRGFTPVLGQKYEQLKADGVPFEIIFVSNDNNLEDSKKYYRSMANWLAVLPKIAANLVKYQDGRGIPQLVIVDKNGQIITKKGRDRISDETLSFPWRIESKAELRRQQEIDSLNSYEEAVEKADLIYIRLTSTSNNKYSDDKIGQLCIIIGLQLFIYEYSAVKKKDPSPIAKLQSPLSPFNRDLLSKGTSTPSDESSNEITIDNEKVLLLSKENTIQKYLDEVGKIKLKEQELRNKIELENQELRNTSFSFDALLSEAAKVWFEYSSDNLGEIDHLIEIWASKIGKMIGFISGWNANDVDDDNITHRDVNNDSTQKGESITFSTGDTVDQKKEKIKEAIQKYNETFIKINEDDSDDSEEEEETTEGAFINEGVSVKEEFKDTVIACVKTMRKRDGKHWHVSAVLSVERNINTIRLDLVLCSGDKCRRLKFSVNGASVNII